jgi:hypothetical protein
MNAAIKGPSGGGKSEIRRQVLEFFPPEEVVSFTTLSDKALLYFQDDFAHKVLSMGEAAATEERELQDYLLRELISEGRLRYPVVQKIENIGMTTVIVEKNGPVAFLVTTTKAALNPENETRMVSLEIDDSDGQTMIVLDKVAQIVGMNEKKAVPWRNFQRWLGAGNCNVVIPFAGELAKKIPPRSVRLRRDFSQILLAIKAHALLHRPNRGRDDHGQVVADIDHDYATIAALMGTIVAEASGAGIPKAIQETIDAVTEATAGMPSGEGATSDKIAKLLKLDQSAAWRRLNNAIHKGFIVNLETRPKQKGRYRATGQELEIEELLPSADELRGGIRGGLHTVHTCIRTSKAEEVLQDNVCASVCTPLAYDDHGDQEDGVCKPHAYGHAYGHAPEKQEEASSVCTYASYASTPKGNTGADGDPFAVLKDPKRRLQLNDDDPLEYYEDGYPKLPACLDRRKGKP